MRETLNDAHWKILTSVTFVVHNEKEDPLLFHGDDFFAEGHDSSLDKLDDMLGVSKIKRTPRVGPTACRGSVILHRRTQWSDTRFSYRADPKHADALAGTLSIKDSKSVATPFARDAGKGQANTLSVLSSTEKAVNMSSTKFVAVHRIGHNGRGVSNKRRDIESGEGRCVGTVASEASGEIPGWTTRNWAKQPISVQPCRMMKQHDCQPQVEH